MKNNHKIFGPLSFKSNTENYVKEISGAKSNTIRQVDENDVRHKILTNIMKRVGYGFIGHKYRIEIENAATGEKFNRLITDVSFYKGWWIISW